MLSEPRRTLNPEEKQDLLNRNKNCYICMKPLEGYSNTEIEFDHIYNYVDGYSQELSNFAPVHASSDPRKLNCHKNKGRKSPYDYREEVRVKTKLDEITGLKDLCKNPIPVVYKISDDKKEVEINGEKLKLYNQKIGTADNYYFFGEIDVANIENDDKIQLRPLEPKILPLVFNLKTSVQLLPSLGRLDPESRTIKIFDGQHKAVAQIIGNNKKKIMCIVFVEPDIDKLRLVVYQAHTDFVQQRYKKSHIDAKLADIYKQKISAFRERVGDPKARYSEKDILNGESKANISKFLLASVISEIQQERSFIRDYAALSRTEQKRKPILWQSIERIIKNFCSLEPVSEYSDSENNFRSEEIENLCFILDQIEEFSIKNKWDPDNSDSINHILSRTYYYRTAFNNWIDVLRESLRFALEQMHGRKIYNAICYQKNFSPEIRERFSNIIKKLFYHPLWVKEEIQNEIAKTNQDSVVKEIFKCEGLDYIYLTKL
ncbi:MAG: hypothetical protein ACYDIA_08875 [Candidatus Humimicrobiaceae bacterium]